ncbi:ABC transporter ATP-binding protein [Sulfobacillus sp. hq2]|uniref:ABC transporter ATP-binding protein n=1 Tax=Sulfobacillus thermotolerans TaxID=338644 RepID=A0ABM6RVX0_9FIRM|nr:ABC transporter ATP-binding protein [Sulfobacillus sp. hq2]AUW95651.1 ABC transporter ATP-binding protein [Sulfobacillus thermotolerans]POB10553.1 ABC transporter ATP-binding protein [Sulfobacillus sp. hq2]
MQACSKHYGQHVAVSDVTLRIVRGQAVALLGPNGAGKTTSLALMMGLTSPSHGSVRLLGALPASPQIHAKIGVMLQNVSVPDRLTVLESVNLFRGFYPHPLPAAEVLEMAGLEEDRRQMASRLSGGKMRRLQFALAMVGNPDVLFLDEPTVGMDVQSKRLFWEMLRQFVEDQRTLILTTHDLHEVDQIADRVVVLNRGRIVADASPEHIKMQIGGRQVSFVIQDASRTVDLRHWPDVTEVQIAGRHVILQTQNSDAVVKRLIQEDWPVSDLMITGVGLEEAFVRLTAREGEL